MGPLWRVVGGKGLKEGVCQSINNVYRFTNGRLHWKYTYDCPGFGLGVGVDEIVREYESL